MQNIIKGLIIKYGAHTVVDDEKPHLLIVENKSKMLRDALVHYKKTSHQ
ncbi:hypothetical protein P344_06370 [Spiroplasma mirum ATCC 29335]|uniref:Uncharacterized protein n=1 Tax=Spiroplasma mirum ATCC 29335 TaxID=838561 RepID=W6AN12_9MOLU|nr:MULTISPECIES: hypothetical protein [Spiroplasma]AHI58577.1 hypothetical protein P344_06370 [Spiroplasma mirum ATCC 29335]